VGDRGDESNLGEFWQKSSYSMSNGHCVETTRLVDGHIGIRDSRAVAGPVLRFGPGAWATFLGELQTWP
jgi:Domain of unknown function (DUF397)